MRYYSIVISDPKTGKVITPKSMAGGGTQATYTSFVSNNTLPGALNVVLDVPVAAYATPMGQAYVQVWGVSLDEIGQASDLNGSAIQIYAGMQKGLPLANPQQAGLIVQGYIFQAFGNWIGTDMTLDLVIVPTATTSSPPNIVLDWKKGTQLSAAIKSTLATAFPDYSASINISPSLVLPEDEPGFYSNLTQFAQYVKQVSKAIIKTDGYNGVEIFLKEKSISVYDGTTQSSPKQLQFQDMIGQPTWIAKTAVQTKFVMRADLNVGDYIQFPKSPVYASSQSVSPLVNEKLTFQGTFLIQTIRHVGNFRQADAASWVTVIDAAAVKPVSAV